MTECMHEGEDHLTNLRGQAAASPCAPGVYLMKDAQAHVLYVGKAKNLRKRLAAYFVPAGVPDPKARALVGRIADFETIVTDSEQEALLLESNLIKRYRPRYNVVLKDDKRYPALRLDLLHPYPNLQVVRKIARDGAQYFGPFASAQAVRETLKIVNRTFKLRKCTNREFAMRQRPCLHAQMGACYGPCRQDVNPALYAEQVREVILFLKGRTPDLIAHLRRQMELAAEAMDFERAAHLRDKIFALEKTLQKQRAVATDLKDRDVLSLARGKDLLVVNLLSIRGGYLQGYRNFRLRAPLASDSEALRAFVRQYYEDADDMPAEILLQHCPEDRPLLQEWFRSRGHGRIQLLCPRRGEKRQLIAMGVQNAQRALEHKQLADAAADSLALRLQKRLRLQSPPAHIECFDNSNLGGVSPVAAMAVFQDGRPAPERHRRYILADSAEPDDYRYMREILTRRFDRDAQDLDMPDLLMVDGGKGQLNIALAVLGELGLTGRLDVIGIAKRDEGKGETEDKIYRPGQANPVVLRGDSDLLLFLQRIRDEAHRLAINFHRRRRTRAALRSQLDGIPGIGATRKAGLLRYFGSLEKIGAATVDELAAAPGMNRRAAEAVWQALQPGRPPGEDTHTPV
jgi:excinuclease ABC subunit C